VRNSIASCIGCAGAVHGGPWETETGFWCVLVAGDYDMLPAQTKKPIQQTKCLMSGNDGAEQKLPILTAKLASPGCGSVNWAGAREQVHA